MGNDAICRLASVKLFYALGIDAWKLLFGVLHR